MIKRLIIILFVLLGLYSCKKSYTVDKHGRVWLNYWKLNGIVVVEKIREHQTIKNVKIANYNDSSKFADPTIEVPVYRFLIKGVSLSNDKETIHSYVPIDFYNDISVGTYECIVSLSLDKLTPFIKNL